MTAKSQGKSATVPDLPEEDEPIDSGTGLSQERQAPCARVGVAEVGSTSEGVLTLHSTVEANQILVFLAWV